MWLKQRSNCSKKSCKIRQWLSTAISTRAISVGNAVAEAARSEVQECDYTLWAMWCSIYAILLVMHRMGTHSCNLMRNGNTMQHCHGMCVSLCGVLVMRNGNAMQHVYGDYINLCAMWYLLFVSYIGLIRMQSYVHRVWLMQNGNAMQHCHCLGLYLWDVCKLFYGVCLGMCGAQSCIQ